MTDKSKHIIVDHLFRHQYGKMVAILSKIFGLANLGLIEDAVQDTFIKAALKWRNEIPENPEAWLIKAAKNRAIDLLRKVNTEKRNYQKISHGSVALEINEYFLDHEVEDSQLRMLLVACHPLFSQEEQIAFALKALSGFSMKEIAAALLQKEETIKKRLFRARKKIQNQKISLAYPDPKEIEDRLSGVLQIIYLIFNEGFHSTKPHSLINKELCGEALRLCKLLLQKERFRSGSLYALFALLCFHSSRLEAKLGSNEIIDLKNQDRSKWYLPLIVLGNNALEKSWHYGDLSIYHYEAAIAAEHVKAIKFENTDWRQILEYYGVMYEIMPTDSILLTMATIHLQLGQLEQGKAKLEKISPDVLSQRKYLFFGCYAEYYEKNGITDQALKNIELAITACPNQLEKQYLERKRKKLLLKSKR